LSKDEPGPGNAFFSASHGRIPLMVSVAKSVIPVFVPGHRISFVEGGLGIGI
jgi:hypothetical protein